MGLAASRRKGLVGRLLRVASERLDCELEEILAKGTPELRRTEVAQAALFVVSTGLALERCARGVVPVAVAGHSVGELAAFTVARMLEPEEALELVVRRGEAMAAAALTQPGGMGALRVESEAALRAMLSEVDGGERLELAAQNAPGLFVLSGPLEALRSLSARAPLTLLPVAGPWHSRAMASAALAWRPHLERATWRPATARVVVNATGEFLTDRDDPADLLLRQLTAPVRWATTMRTLEAAGVTRYELFGPGATLRGLCRANLAGEFELVLHEDELQRAAA